MQALDVLGKVAVAIAVGISVAVFVAGLVLWLRERRPPMSADWCSVCMVDLRRGSVYEVRTDHEADEQGGGTYLATTYCRRHAPRGAHRV